MTLSKGTQISICPQCRAVVNFSKLALQSKPINQPYSGIEAIGATCPHCQHFRTFYYLNSTLRQMQNPNATRKQRRRYEVIFRRLQYTMRHKDAISV